MGIGRGMKVGKEEIVGLLAAVERFVTLNHDAEWHTWEARTSHILAELSKVPGVAVRRDVPEIANRFPQVVVEWSRWHAAPAADEVVRRLWDGDPRIAVLLEGPHGLRIVVFTLRDDETSSPNESARSSRGAERARAIAAKPPRFSLRNPGAPVVASLSSKP